MEFTMDIQKRLFQMQDEKYADFQSKLTPTIPREKFIGVRVPKLRKLAKEYIKEAGRQECGREPEMCEGSRETEYRERDRESELLAGNGKSKPCESDREPELLAGNRKSKPCENDRVPGLLAGNRKSKPCENDKEPELWKFLEDLPHQYYDENILHGMLVSEIKDYKTCVRAVDTFLPYVDNWAVCDTMSPKAFKKHRTELLEKIREWVASDQVYTCRFGIRMIMVHFLDEDYRPEYLEPVADIRSEEYYVNMMIAWFFATALAKQWDTVIPYLTGNRLSVWVHNKTIQKARESYRITDEQKVYLKSLKR